MNCCKSLYPVQNERRAGPNAADPSRTGGILRLFLRELDGRFERLKDAVNKLLNEEDALGKAPHPFNHFATNASYSYCSTQFNITDGLVRARLKRQQAFLVPSDVVKMETVPHITVRYGLHPQNDLPERVFPLLEGGSVHVRIGKLTVFSLPDKDVLVYLIDGPGLHNLNRRLALLPHTQTFPVYVPHMTVAYLLPGTGAKYLDMPYGASGIELLLSKLSVSDLDGTQEELTVNTRWKFSSDPEILKGFQQWLKSQIREWVIGRDEEQLWHMYAAQGFIKGAGRAFDDSDKTPSESHQAAPLFSEGKHQDHGVSDFYRGSKEEFLRSAFAQPIAVDKIKLLAGRSFSDLKGITEAMSTAMVRTLTDGLVKGDSPREIARQLNKDVDGIGRARAVTIARTEIIRAHAEGQLEALRQLGETHVSALVEWSTAGDARVCPMCKPLQGIVLKLEEARGMLPRHPNCRCAWIPAGVGEPTKGQKLTAPKIRAAIRKSQKAGLPLKKKVGGMWGPGSKVSTSRSV